MVKMKFFGVDNRQLALMGGLVLLFAVLVSVPFLVPGAGIVSLFAIVPLLAMERIASLLEMRKVWIFHYTAFVLWNAFTTFWVCNATVGGGLFAIFANAFQMSLIFGLFRYSRKSFRGPLPYIFLAVAWIAWERFYFDAEISWPWLVLGNSFARSTSLVQWYEFTGTLGGSLWIWASNLGIFGILVTLSDGSWGCKNAKWKAFVLTAIATIIIAPIVVSKVIYHRYEEVGQPVEVAVIQPNIDPYSKFRAMSQQQQNAILEGYMAGILTHSDPTTSNQSSNQSSNPSLILAPETFTGDIITGDYSYSPTWRRFTSFLRAYPGVNLLFGASSYTYIESPEKPSHTARPAGSGRWMESHNSALMVDGTSRTEMFHKNKLVVAVEKTPYPAFFCRIDDMLGGVMGRCVGQDSVSLMHVVTSDGESIPVGCAICYESVYGEYYTDYVAKGAEFMTIITNDAWWGDTPGYRQHLSYASLRAIETRRSIARCANTGISAFINQRGDVVETTPWWQPAVLTGTVNRNSELTFFVMHGDVAGRLASFVFWLLLAVLLVQKFSGTKVGC